MHEETTGKLMYDETFLNFCFQRDTEDTAYWMNWLKEHPESEKEVLELRNLLVLLAEQSGKTEVEEQQEQLSRRIASAQSQHNGRLSLFRWVAAASVLLILSATTFLLFNKNAQTKLALNQMRIIKPGGNKAFLTLANGQRIVLNDAANGLIAKQSDVQITKNANGQLVYALAKGQTTSSNEFNTIETPKGGQYLLYLPDGSKVWLNAASKLKYPASFSGQRNRSVELDGEAYFEVAKDKQHPFMVKTGRQQVEVLGTHFNINAYKDEVSVKTTLLEGSVRVFSADPALSARVLHPGQQSSYDPLISEIKVATADTEAAVAWKDGLFYFKDADIPSIMKVFARWYNVEVGYEGEIPKRKFSGKIYRNVNAAQAIEILNYSDIHLKLEKTAHSTYKIIVTP
ncbi:FecR family protein [Pedobacter sp. HMWF019]|uniref:FecR family protein n=1 Tax=Pedobacter sp. HMWF019 TaxID=2056856 RepID=UPI001304C6F9|nr:FecR family protein [Pedobacter sp. HMWF019]